MLFKGESLNKLAKIFGNFFLTVNNKLEKKFCGIRGHLVGGNLVGGGLSRKTTTKSSIKNLLKQLPFGEIYYVIYFKKYIYRL